MPTPDAPAVSASTENAPAEAGSGAIAIIPARGGSKGLPGKNLAHVGGVPLVVRAVRTALAAPSISSVVVSTDDAAIAAAARAAGATVVDRPAELADDAASSESALLHALDAVVSAADAEAGSAEPEVLVFLQATSPFIDADDLEAAIRRVRDGDEDVVFSAAETHAFIWRETAEGAMGVNHSSAVRLRRQDRQPDYAESGAFYVMRTAGFRQAGHRFFGRIGLQVVDAETGFEIDDAADLERALQLADREPTPASDAAAGFVRIGENVVGPGSPVYVIAEIGLNHNGDLGLALELMDVAARAGAQAVKFQKRTPEIATPEHMKSTPRDTPWGRMTYLEYRYRVEFEREEYTRIAEHAAELGLDWFASPWDVPSVHFLEQMDVAAHKVASAGLTDTELLTALAETGKPVILSTGMSTLEQIDAAVELLGRERLILLHATSTYPLPPEEANLRTIGALRDRYPGVPVGYSGHEPGLQISLAAVGLGAVAVERHITLDRGMWGSDHSASLEPGELADLVRDIRVVESALGDGVKRVFPGEEAPMAKLRRVQG